MKSCRCPEYILLIFCLFMDAGVPAAQHGQPLRTVDRVDLDRYAGTWYEIARLPNRFQRRCHGDVTADYSRRQDGTLEVVNRCRESDGSIDEARGVARVVDTATNARLEVSFVSLFGWQLFWGDYWILDLGGDYSYSIVGEPDRKYGWVLSRTKQLPPGTWEHVRRVLDRAGYDPDRFVLTRQETPVVPR